MKLTLLLLLLLLLSPSATAAGIGTAPAEINFSVEKGKTQQRELVVYNLGDSAFELDVTSDSDSLSFSHAGSIIANGKGKLVVEADAKKLKQGNYSQNVYVTSKSRVPGVMLSLGTAVKANIEVFTTRKTNAETGAITSTAVVIFGLLAYLAAERLKGYLTSQKA